jgi:hypothetical protein
MKKELQELADEFMAEDADELARRPKDQRSQAQILVELAADVQLFHTPEGDAYAQVAVGTHSETWSLRSKGFRRWLTGQFYRALSKPPGNHDGWCVISDPPVRFRRTKGMRALPEPVMGGAISMLRVCAGSASRRGFGAKRWQD